MVLYVFNIPMIGWTKDYSSPELYVKRADFVVSTPCLEGYRALGLWPIIPSCSLYHHQTVFLSSHQGMSENGTGFLGSMFAALMS